MISYLVNFIIYFIFKKNYLFENKQFCFEIFYESLFKYLILMEKKNVIIKLYFNFKLL